MDAMGVTLPTRVDETETYSRQGNPDLNGDRLPIVAAVFKSGSILVIRVVGARNLSV
jgi:hypothetical protein